MYDSCFEILDQAIQCSSYYSQHRAQLYDAYLFAARQHDGQVRRMDGSPFITHPVQVALLLINKVDDVALVTAALLHDVVEDCEVTMPQIYERFGEEIGFLVDAVTKTSLHYHGSDECYSDYIDKILAGGMRDARVLLLKLTDRKHNIETINGLPAEKQSKVSLETGVLFGWLSYFFEQIDNRCTRAHHASFCSHLVGESITTCDELRDYLYSFFVHTINTQTYDVLYRNAGRVIWRLEGRKERDEFRRLPIFNTNVRIVTMKRRQGTIIVHLKVLPGGESAYSTQTSRLMRKSFSTKKYV